MQIAENAIIHDNVKGSLSSSKEILKEYQGYRSMGSEVCTRLLKYIPKNAIIECAKKFGAAKGRTLLLNSEDELSVLFNYAIFHHYINGKNAIDRYVSVNSNKIPEAERIVINAMQKAQYAILSLEKIIKHGGVIVVDYLNNQKKDLLIDINFSKTATDKILLATTILRYPRFIVTTGTSLPLNTVIKDVAEDLHHFIERHTTFDSASKKDQTKFITKILKTCFAKNASENIRYEEQNGKN